MTGFLSNRTGVILGVANKRSIAWACAKALASLVVDAAGVRPALG